jgi:hypothetical protein
MSRILFYLHTPVALCSAIVIAAMLSPTQARAAPPNTLSSEKAKIVEHWTQARRTSAIPRDLFIDRRGLGYMRLPDGSFQPYGHQVAAEVRANGAQPMAKPDSNKETNPPVITNMDPTSGKAIGSSHTFKATITDESGIKSVTFTIRYPDGVTTQTFTPTMSGNNSWSIRLQGFSDSSDWAWWVQARDRAGGRGNIATSEMVGFTVDTNASSG